MEFARSLVQGYRARDRMGRIAAIFTFVGHLVDAPSPAGECRDGVDVLLALAGEQEGPAVIVAALLQALGERASVDYVPGMAFARVELSSEDLPRLPPFADLLTAGGRYYIPLDARQARSTMCVLPPPLRAALRSPSPRRI